MTKHFFFGKGVTGQQDWKSQPFANMAPEKEGMEDLVSFLQCYEKW